MCRAPMIGAVTPGLRSQLIATFPDSFGDRLQGINNTPGRFGVVMFPSLAPTFLARDFNATSLWRFGHAAPELARQPAAASQRAPENHSQTFTTSDRNQIPFRPSLSGYDPNTNSLIPSPNHVAAFRKLFHIRCTCDRAHWVDLPHEATRFFKKSTEYENEVASSKIMNPSRDFAWAHGLARLGLGINIALHGYIRLANLAGFASHLKEQFAQSILPASLVYASGYAIAIGEAAIGTLLILGVSCAQRLLPERC